MIAAGRTARVIANGTVGHRPGPAGDRGHRRPPRDIGNLADALRLASALAARSGDAEILVATDAALATPPTGSVEAPVRVLRVGRDAGNQAIVALAVRTAPSGLSHSAFISVANLGLELVERQVQLFADGQLRDSRTLHLDPQRRTDVSIDDIDDPQHPASVIEVRLRRRRWRDAPRRRTRSASTTGPGPSSRPRSSARSCSPASRTRTSRPR